MSEAITNAISVLCDCRDALRECDRDGDYKLIDLIDDTCAALSQTAPLDGEVTDEQIDALIKKHARGLYSSSQLDWEVAEFHRFGLLQLIDAILALRPQAVPMTDGQRDDLAVTITTLSALESRKQLVLRAIDWVEAHHGITAKAEGGA